MIFSYRIKDFILKNIEKQVSGENFLDEAEKLLKSSVAETKHFLWRGEFDYNDLKGVDTIIVGSQNNEESDSPPTSQIIKLHLEREGVHFKIGLGPRAVNRWSSFEKGNPLKKLKVYADELKKENLRGLILFN